MNKNKYRIFFSIFPIGVCFLLLSLAAVPAHKYYFSLSEIKVDTKKQSVSVSCKLFTDDLQDALKAIHHKKFDLNISTENKEVQTLLYNYITERLKLSVANKEIKLNFVGFENEDDVTWCYLEGKTTTTGSKKIKITNSLLYELFPDETNIIQLQWDELKRSEKLVNPNKEVVVDFN